MAAVLELLLREEVPVAAAVRWIARSTPSSEVTVRTRPQTCLECASRGGCCFSPFSQPALAVGPRQGRFSASRCRAAHPAASAAGGPRCQLTLSPRDLCFFLRIAPKWLL